MIPPCILPWKNTRTERFLFGVGCLRFEDTPQCVYDITLDIHIYIGIDVHGYLVTIRERETPFCLS